MKKIHQHKETEDSCDSYVLGSAFFAIFIHIFCCGIPAVLAVLSAFGIYAPLPFEHKHNGIGEILMFVLSGGFLILSYYLYSRHNHCDCGHKHESKDTLSKTILSVTTVLYLFGIYTHFIKDLF
ncbi:MAG: hypothetical protein ACK5N8_00285 [Alphaproteobacteria bacterium]